MQRHLERDGWLVTRAAGSLGIFDLVALKAGETPKLIEVKSTSGGPFERFGPGERERALTAALGAGGTVELWWWPKAKPGETLEQALRVILPSEWPAR